MRAPKTREVTKPGRKYLFVCDFDRTLSFDDTGVVLSMKIGINPDEYDKKVNEVRKRNIAQLGGELAYLIISDPDYKGKVTKKLFEEVGAEVRLKKNIAELMRILSEGMDGNTFCCYVLSACPQDIITTALSGILEPDHIYGTVFIYDEDGKVKDIKHTCAGQGKVAILDSLREKERVPRDGIIYVGDGLSDLHVMLHVSAYGGYPIAVSASPYLGHISKRTVLSDNALSILVPILEDIMGYRENRIKAFFEEIGHTISEWSRAKIDWITLED